VSTLNDLALEVYDRIEENRSAPTFWVPEEIYALLNEALNEAALITGEPEVRQISTFTLNPNETIFDVPTEAVALIRVQAPNWIEKTSVWELDRFVPGWESQTGSVPKAWFPIGLTQFGIYPQLQQPVNAALTYVGLPITSGPSFTGGEFINYQQEFNEGFIDYAAHAAGLKQGGEEFIQSSKVYDRFLEKMMALSNFAWRKAQLRFTRTLGSPAALNPAERQ
jgi:hypothetical protein